MRMTEKKMAAILSLSGEARYEYFVKTVADWGEVWGLYKDGWALAASEVGEKVFPLWPAKEFAELCAVNEWDGYEAESISLEELFGGLLPNLREDGVLPGIFYTPSDTDVTPSIDILINHFSADM